MRPVQKLVSLALLLLGLMVVPSAQAAQLLDASLSLGDSRPSVVTTHSITFKNATNATIQSFYFRYCTTPSGSCTQPTNLDISAFQNSVKGALTGLTDGDWTLKNSVKNVPVLEHTGAGETINAGETIIVPIQNALNHAIDDCQAGGQQSTDTCYVRITSYTDKDGLAQNAVDTAIVSYTVVAAVTVSARVDPSFTFVVESVDSNQTRNGITTSAASTYFSLPFGNLTAGTPRYVAHGLRVTTNTQGGYTVTARMLQQMTGNYSQNNIDPFTSAWGTPTVWSSPTGTTPNDNTGWIGANTTDTDVAGWSTGSNPSGKFGTVGPTANIVMRASGSDNGTNVIYVTYAIEANVFQPADTYSGTLQYNALPTY